MAFTLDALFELLIGGQWIPVRTYDRDTIELGTGRPERAAHTDPGSLAITIDNRGGRWSPRNPMSEYYGQFGRGTRGRLSVPGTVSRLELDGNVANQASTPDHASLDITGDLDIRWEGEADWYAPGAQILIGKWGDDGNRSYHMRLQDSQLFLHTTTDGTIGPNVGFPLPALPRHAALRAVVDVDNGAGGRTWRVYWAETIDGPWTQFSVEVTGTPNFTIFAGTAPLTIAPEQIDSFGTRLPVTGRVTAAEVRDGIDGTIVAAPDFAAQNAGTTSFTDSAGRTWTLAGTAVIRDRADLIVVEIPEWPQHWEPDEADAWVPIEGAGILRRLGQGRKALQSTLRRRIPSFSPVAYWPMEEDANATQAASPITGVAAFTPAGLDFASDDTLAGSSPLPTVGDPASFAASVPPAAAGEWQVELVYFLEAMPSTESTMFEVRSTGTARRVRVRIATNLVRIQGFDANDVELFNGFTTSPQFNNAWNRLQIRAVPNGGNVDYSVRWVIIGGTGFSQTETIAASAGRVTQVRSTFENLEGLRFGHLAVLDNQTDDPFNSADTAFTGENAWDRMRRLAEEESLPLARIPGPETPEAVGAQTPDTLLTLLQDAADADGGLLLEDPTRPGLLYRERSSMYSQDPALTLSYNKAPGLAAPLKPVDDDTAVRNDRTVKRAGGSEGRAVKDEGPLAVDAIGQYDDSVTLSLHEDTQTEPIAYWRLHLGTVDEPRYPTVRVWLHKAPHLIPDVLAVREGDLIRITDLPAFVGFGDVDLIVDGIHHEMSRERWEVTFNCSPGQPWAVGAVAYTEDFSDADLSVTITDGGDLPWARSQAQSHSATWSLRSGAITNNQTSDAIVTVPAGARSLSFWYWTSSEEAGPGFEGDRLLVLADGAQVLRAQGETPWTQAIIDVTGKATVTFRYAKDNSAASGDDAAHIDDLVFTTRAPMRVDANPGGSTLALATGTDTGQIVVHTPARDDTRLPVPWITSDGPAPTYPAEFPYDIKFGGETARVTANVPAAWDTFTRSETDEWGTSDSGFTWIQDGGQASDRSVNGSAGVITLAADPGTIRFQRIVGNIADCEVLLRMSVDQIATGASLLPSVLLRYTSGSDYYRARLHFGTSGSMFVSITRASTAIGSTPSLPYTYSAAEWFWVRVRLTGHRVQMRVWPDNGTLEPAVWHKDETITADTIDSGQLGVSGSAFNTNTNTSPELRYDDYRIVTPQLMTVTRSLNRVVKPHADGTEVRVAHPAVVAR